MPPDPSAGLEPAFRDVLTFNAVAGREFPTAPELPPLQDYQIQRFRRLAADMRNEVHELRAAHAGRTLAHPAGVSESPTALAMQLVTEEAAEVLTAVVDGRLDDVADNLVDLIYVALGAAAMFGLDIPRVWDAVHGANMAKLKLCPSCEGRRDANMGAGGTSTPCSTCRGLGRVAILDAGGKVMKPAGWTPPDVAQVLAKQPAGALDRHLATPALRPFSLSEATAAVFPPGEDLPAGDKTIAALFTDAVWKGAHGYQFDASGVHTLLLATSEIALAGGVRLHHPFSGVTLREVVRAIRCLRAAGFLPPEPRV